MTAVGPMQRASLTLHESHCVYISMNVRKMIHNIHILEDRISHDVSHLYSSAYIASESCRSLSDCRHTKCNNSTTGWRVVCHHNGSISGTCLCSEDTITGKIENTEF